MSRHSAKIAYELWNCHTKQAADLVLENYSYTYEYFNGRINNRSNANNSQDVYSSLIETITNGHDAVIIDRMNTGFFDAPPANVKEAVDAINQQEHYHIKPYVNILIANRTGNPDQNTITIIDDGSGIDEKKIEKTILAYSSDSKINSPYQHGTYGQGGSATMAFSDGQLIFTKSRKSDVWFWTYLYTIENENGIPSYVYIKNEKGNLFSFSKKDMDSVSTFVTTTEEAANISNNAMVLPLHGTVRRMIGMPVDAGHDRATSIFRIIPDKMFGSNCYTRIISDYERTVVTGRRIELDSGVVGQKINAGESPVLLGVVEETPLTVVSMGDTFKVSLKAWFLDNFKKKGRDHTGVRGLLSHEPKNAAASIFMTFNGQTHGVLTNRRVLSEAGFNCLIENVVIEVSMNDFSMMQMNKAVVSNRETLKKNFENDLAKAIVDFIEHNEKFIEFNEHFSSSGETNENLIRDLNEIIKTEMIGSISSMKSFGRGEGGSTSNRAVINSFVPRDPPTFLSVYDVTVIPGQTAWVTFKTNAPDHYGNFISYFFPHFVSVVGGTNKLKNGVMRVQIMCDPNTEVGTTDKIMVSMKNLEADTTIEVVAQKRKKNMKSTVPHVNYVRVNGKDDPEYVKAFPGITDEMTGTLNYRYDEHSKTLTVFENTKAPEFTKTKNFLEKHSKGSSSTLDKIVSISFTSAAIMVNKVSGFGSSGATDAESHEILSAIGVGHIGSAGALMKKYILNQN